MLKQGTINWDKLAAIKELKPFFENDFEGFQTLIETNIEKLEQFSDEALNKFAKLRALEVVNGCTQWGFRLGDENCLSVEQTRDCMNLVMGFMKRQELYFPSEGKIELSEDEKAFTTTVRSLYQKAFKDNDEQAKKQFYASSIAQFFVLGEQRLKEALALVQKDYQHLFSQHYIEKGRQYIQRYLDSFTG